MGYPVVLNINGRSIVVIGGGTVATRKITRLLENSANVTVIAPEASQTIEQWAQADRLTLHLRSYHSGDLTDAHLVFAATNSSEVNAQVATEAKARNLWVNVADNSAPSDFTLPAIADLVPLQIAIDTSGGGPALSSALRQHLEATLSPGWRRATIIFNHLRPMIRNQSQEAQRQRFWRTLARSLPQTAEGDIVKLTGWIQDAAEESHLALESEALQQALQTTLDEYNQRIVDNPNDKA